MPTYTPVANAADIAAVQAVLKETFPEDRLESQLYTDMVVLDWFEETTEFTDSVGLKAVVPLHTGRTGAVSARQVGEKLGMADRQKVDRAEYVYTHQYVTVKVEGPVVARMKTNRQAVVREIDLEIDGAIDDLRRDWVRQLYAAGDSVIVSALAAQAGTAGAKINIPTAQEHVVDRGYIYVGMVVDVGTLANPSASYGGIRITAIDDTPGAMNFTFTPADGTAAPGTTTVASGDRIVRSGNWKNDGFQRELNGFGNLISRTSTLGGIDPTAPGKGYWKSQHETNASNRDLTLALMLNLIKKLRSQGRYPDFAVADLNQEQRYYQLLQGQVRYAGDSSLKGGAGNTEGLAVGRIKSGLVGDPDCNPGVVYMGDKKSLKMYSAGKVDWQNQTTGGDILAWSQDYDAFVARAAKYFQTGTNRRKSLGVLDKLNT